jgi:aminoglycoside/choline kinase family phosphotransferase
MSDDLQARLDAYLSTTGLTGARATLLTGDASDRRYVRVAETSGATHVLAVHPGPIQFDAMPFAGAATLFASMPVPIPRVIGHWDSLGVIALEDLGDVTLQAHLEATARATLHAHYREAVALVATMQRRGTALATPSLVPYTLAFDVPKLMFELRFFATHFLEGHRGLAIPAASREALEAEFTALAQVLSDEPRVVCHRDYHSRNLMVHDGRLVVIDFQDARLGPDTYDLVSLLRDSYVELESGDVEALIAHFLTLDRGPLGDTAATRFRARFDTMALQRNLKALGTFGYQATVRGKTSYLADVPRTLGYVRTTMQRSPSFGRLQALLAALLPELRA